MARKGWDALSDAYRNRLERQGISRRAYESGSSLHKARGHVSQPSEAFASRLRRFASEFATPENAQLGVPEVDAQELTRRIRSMGPTQGQEYMDYRRMMTRLYERGDYERAQTLYRQRPKGVSGPASMWWYHGMFGG